MIRLTPQEFSKFFAETVNTYIRFVNLDDKNKSRCSLKTFWLKFIGTVERASLRCKGVAVNAFERAKLWLGHSLSPTLSAIIERVGKDKFFDLIYESNPKMRYKTKHNAILNSCDEEITYTCKDLWDGLVPEPLENIAVFA